MLVQDVDKFNITKSKLKVVTRKNPSKKEIEDLVFAFKVVKYVGLMQLLLLKIKRL